MKDLSTILCRRSKRAMKQFAENLRLPDNAPSADASDVRRLPSKATGHSTFVFRTASQGGRARI